MLSSVHSFNDTINWEKLIRLNSDHFDAAMYAYKTKLCVPYAVRPNSRALASASATQARVTVYYSDDKFRRWAQLDDSEGCLRLPSF